VPKKKKKLTWRSVMDRLRKMRVNQKFKRIFRTYKVTSSASGGEGYLDDDYEGAQGSSTVNENLQRLYGYYEEDKMEGVKESSQFRLQTPSNQDGSSDSNRDDISI
jgi:hypothetical protein